MVHVGRRNVLPGRVCGIGQGSGRALPGTVIICLTSVI
jgi:hypothetical protein